MAAQIRSLPSRYSIVMTVVLALIAMFAINASFSDAEGLPANKVAAAGSDVDVIAPAADKLVLSEVMKVSTTRDLMLHLSAECSILTRLNTVGSATPGAAENDFAFGQVKMYIKIDGTRVPVAAVDSSTDTNGDEDLGEVVFCNRAYERTVKDMEEDEGGTAGGDGIDGENDYIRTRTANAFTWLALDAGRFDDPANGNNVIQVDVFAEYDTSASGTPTDPVTPTQSCIDRSAGDADPLGVGPTCADAFVGSRTLVVDSDVAAVRETVQEKDEPTAYVRS